METKNLSLLANKAVENEDRALTFDALDDIQQYTLTAASMRDYGKHVYEYVVESSKLDEVVGLLINTLEADSEAATKELKAKIADLLIEGAVEYAREQIEKALEAANANLALTQQFYANEERELIDNDNRQRARDMNSRYGFI
jgi:hypothetical protein